MKNILGFVPARGGSKGIPNKNLTPLNGKPLIWYSLQILKELKNCLIPFISSDSNEILKYCRSQGFNISYSRPSQLATDKSLLIDAIFHALDWLEGERKFVPTVIVILQPTSPLRESKLIKDMLNKFENENLESLISVTPMREHPNECVQLKNQKWKKLNGKKEIFPLRQNYEDNFYFIDGSVYIVTLDFLKKNRTIVDQKITKLFISDNRYSIDIDYPEDLIIAEAIIKYKLDSIRKV